jgi:hypothetical protein
VDDGSEPAPLADDFKRIPGIGPVIEAHLHRAGVVSYAQLAALSPQQIAKLIEHLPLLSVERIVRQDWVGQARALAAETSPPAPETPPHRQYVSFLVELRLDGRAAVRRTRAVHLQDGEEDTWSGWDEKRLLQFVAEYAAAGAADTGRPAEPREPLAAQRPAADDAPRVEVVEVTVGVPPSEPRGLVAQVHFRLDGLEAPDASPYSATVLAWDTVSGAVTLLGTSWGQLERHQREHVAMLDLAPPDIGRYQLVGVILLVEALAVGSAPGPMLQVLS